ncbi:hypothetical protein GCK32_005075 [Trichostrongylus colubriformis]|uniref:PHD-type domain-containing protein n=1 Tax=Trichostrongylus colubriformis TaxID=6319 RepID=A0AAN8FMY1_TRICO
MPGSAVRVTERAPSLRISLRKRTVTQIPEAPTPTPTPAKTPRSQPKKRGRPSASKSKSQSTARSTVDGRTRAGRGRSSGKYKHTRPWEVDDGDDRAYDYVSCSESESSSSEEEEYSLRTSPLSSTDNSRLLSEIHLVLLRMCFKNDDEEQVHFSGNETNNAYNIVTACLEPMTYAEVLRQYLSSDVNVPAEVMEAVNAPNYPFVDFSTRLVLITFLSYRFLYSNEYKKTVVAAGGRLEHEDTCRSCSKGGDVIMCDTCEAVFHTTCINLESKPENWICELCESNKVRGVQDCLPLDEFPSKQPLRMEPIGRDRHGRFYWFVARRIFVHNIDESDLRYYSTAPQFYELVKLMDPSFYEFHLCKLFFERLSDILEQMSVTLELSSDRRDTLYRENYSANKALPAEVYLQQDNMYLMAEILTVECDGNFKAEESEEEPTLDDEKPFASLIDYFKTMLGLSHGRLVNNFWSGNVEESELLQLKGGNSENGLRPDPSKLFRMGCPSDDSSFSKYKNFFVEHKFGEHPATKKKMIDKKKYLCSKFSLMEEGEWAFEWSIAKGHTLYGSEKLQTLYVSWTIGKLLRKIPIELMQRKWRDALPAFKKELDSPLTSWQKLRDLLLRLECGMRRTLFLPQWWNNLGHTRLTRTTVDDRERMVKEAQRRKKEERETLDAVDDEIIVVKHTKMPQGISRELTRMRDEKYRVYGRGELGGWIWISRTLVRDIRDLPSSHSSRKGSSIEEAVAVDKKIRRLEEVASRLKRWRTAQESMHDECEKNCVCYSPNCRMGIPSRSVCSDDIAAGYQLCYSQECRKQEVEARGTCSGIVKAYDPTRIPTPQKGVLGEDLPWPLPEVNNFVSRGSKRKSIFVVPQVTLRRLAKTGGRKAIYVPSFSATAKGNLQYWNYPTPRPCFDLCWRWLTVNCSSLQAVALQLRILWASVRWQDMKPEDDDPDRRVVNHYPDRDERRWISLHKEYGPPCIYERYRLSIEVLPLDDDNGVDEEDDTSWTSSERERRKSARRRKPQSQSSRIRRVSQIKEEWVDGVDLKLYEIYDYWRGFSERFTNRIKPPPQTAQKVHPPRPAVKPPQPAKERIASPIPTANVSRKAVPVQDRVRPPPVRATSSPSQQQLRHASAINTDRSRKVQRINDYHYFSSADEREDEESCDSTYTEGSELTGWEPRVAKRPRLSTPRMDSSRLLQTLTPPVSRAVSGRPYQVGYIRGGGRGAVPVGDGMQPAGLLEESVVPLGAEETIVTSDTGAEEVASSRHVVSTRHLTANGVSTDGPPVIPRYDNASGSYSGRVASRVLPPLTGTRMVHSASAVSRPPVVVPSGAGKLLMVRRSDGTTQFLRQIPQPSDESVPTPISSVRSRIPQNIRTASGARVLQIPGSDQDHLGHSRMVVSSEPSVAGGNYEQSVDPFMKRMAVEKAVSAATSSSQGMVRQVPRTVGLHGGELYSDTAAKDEQMIYGDQGARAGVHAMDRFQSPRYAQNFSVHRVAPRGATPVFASGGRVQPTSNSQRVYYVKNAVTIPSRVVLAPAPVESYVREEVVTASFHRSASSSSTLTEAITEELFPRFPTVDEDWNEFGYLLESERNSSVKKDTEPSRGSGSGVRNADASRPVPVAINPAEISLGGDAVDWTKDSENSAEVKEKQRDEDGNEGDSKVIKDEGTVEESTAVADWQPSRRGPALSTTVKYKKRMYERSLEESSSSGSEVRRRGRPPKRRHREIEQSTKGKQSPLGLNPNTLHCICRATYDPTRFYVACEMCYRWFHGDCVDVSEESAKEMDGWTCRDCKRETERAQQEQELYCICRTPYSDSEYVRSRISFDRER